MTDAATQLRCLHCDAAPSAREIADGWCDSCGKRLPESYAAHAKRETAAAAPAAAARVSSRPRFVWGVALVLVVAVVAVVAMAV